MLQFSPLNIFPYGKSGVWSWRWGGLSRRMELARHLDGAGLFWDSSLFSTATNDYWSFRIWVKTCLTRVWLCDHHVDNSVRVFKSSLIAEPLLTFPLLGMPVISSTSVFFLPASDVMQRNLIHMHTSINQGEIICTREGGGCQILKRELRAKYSTTKLFLRYHIYLFIFKYVVQNQHYHPLKYLIYLIMNIFKDAILTKVKGSCLARPRLFNQLIYGHKASALVFHVSTPCACFLEKK